MSLLLPNHTLKGFGTVTLHAMPCVLPLLASVPPQVSSAYKSGAAKFYKDLFEAMWQGLSPCRADLASHSACDRSCWFGRRCAHDFRFENSEPRWGAVT